MKFRCKVITRSSKNKIVGIESFYKLGQYIRQTNKGEDLPFLKVYLTTVPERGKANKKLIEILSKALNKPKSEIRIERGEKCHDKIIEIND